MDYAGFLQVGIWKQRLTFPDLQVEISLGKTKLPYSGTSWCTEVGSVSCPDGRQLGINSRKEGREKETNEGKGGADERREKRWREEEKRERETGIGKRINKHDSTRVKYVP